MLSVKGLPFGLFPHVSARCFEGGSMPTLCSFFHFISLMRLLLVVGRREGRGRGFRNPVPPPPTPTFSQRNPSVWIPHPSLFLQVPHPPFPSPFLISPPTPTPTPPPHPHPHPNRYLWTDCSLISRNESSNVLFLA